MNAISVMDWDHVDIESDYDEILSELIWLLASEYGVNTMGKSE